MMTKEEFTNELVKHLISHLPLDTRINIQSVQKNNQRNLTGLCIANSTSNVAPVLYIDNYYEDYLKGISFLNIANAVFYTAKDLLEKNTTISLDFLRDWETLKHKIFYKVVNADSNRDYLETVAHIDFLNLSKVFCISVNDELSDGFGVITITHHLMDLIDCSLEELAEVAETNTPCLFPMEFMNLRQTLDELMSIDLMEIPPSDISPFYILTNKAKCNGASVMFYPDLLHSISEKFNSSFYIIPSSIHEVLIMFDSAEISPLELKSIVKEVNLTLAQEDFLSDSIYYYSIKTNSISVA